MQRDHISRMQLPQLRQIVSACFQDQIDRTFAADWAKAAVFRMALRGTDPTIAVRTVWDMPESALPGNPFGLSAVRGK